MPQMQPCKRKLRFSQKYFSFPKSVLLLHTGFFCFCCRRENILILRNIFPPVENCWHLFLLMTRGGPGPEKWRFMVWVAQAPMICSPFTSAILLIGKFCRFIKSHLKNILPYQKVIQSSKLDPANSFFCSRSSFLMFFCEVSHSQVLSPQAIACCCSKWINGCSPGTSRERSKCACSR